MAPILSEMRSSLFSPAIIMYECKCSGLCVCAFCNHQINPVAIPTDENYAWCNIHILGRDQGIHFQVMEHMSVLKFNAYKDEETTHVENNTDGDINTKCNVRRATNPTWCRNNNNGFRKVVLEHASKKYRLLDKLTYYVGGVATIGIGDSDSTEKKLGRTYVIFNIRAMGNKDAIWMTMEWRYTWNTKLILWSVIQRHQDQTDEMGYYYLSPFSEDNIYCIIFSYIIIWNYMLDLLSRIIMYTSC